MMAQLSRDGREATDLVTIRPDLERHGYPTTYNPRLNGVVSQEELRSVIGQINDSAAVQKWLQLNKECTPWLCLGITCFLFLSMGWGLLLCMCCQKKNDDAKVAKQEINRLLEVANAQGEGRVLWELDGILLRIVVASSKELPPRQVHKVELASLI
jgi:hypothetical protein